MNGALDLGEDQVNCARSFRKQPYHRHVESLHVWLVLGAAALGIAIGISVTLGISSLKKSIAAHRGHLSRDVAITLEEVPLMAVLFDRSLTPIARNRTARENPVTVETLRNSKWFRSYLRDASNRGSPVVRPSNEAEPYWVHLHKLEDGMIVALIVDDQDKYDTEKLRREFVANASHELNTPVAALSLLSEAIVAANGDPEKVKHFSSSLTKEVDRLSSLTRDIARLSEAESGWEKKQLEPVDLVALINTVADEHATLAAASDAELVVSGYEGELKVLADWRGLTVAVGNLVENAIQHSSAGDRVSIGLTSEDKIARLTVSDQGIGIDAEHLPHIFKRFYRVDMDRGRRSGGTGLGLSIARNTARSLKGDLTVWSKLGVGSTFTLRLPVWEDKNEA